LILSIAAILLLAACRKDAEELGNPNRQYNINTYVKQFEVIWHGIDNSYVFWGRDTVDWDAKYETYHPLFEALDHKDVVTDEEFTELWKGVVGRLIDHHFVLKIKNLRTGKTINIGGGSRDIKERADYQSVPDSFLLAALRNHSQLSTLYENKEGCECYAALFDKSNGKKIAYFRLKKFQLADLIYITPQRGDPYVREATNKAWKPLLNFYGPQWMRYTFGYDINFVNSSNPNGWINDDNVEGLIIDVRNNGGGNADDLTPLIGGLLQSPLHYGYSRVKEGLGRLDYSAWTPFNILVPPAHMNRAKPIVILANASSASCSEITTQSIHSLPNGTFVGKRTEGATCPLLPGYFDLLNSGCFGGSDASSFNDLGYYVYTSNFDLVTTDYSSLEGIGVVPDIDCAIDLNSHNDAQLDKALEILNQ
ncbi:MAG: hypothetical protein KBT04_03065, partial [Bacteroidales bacterium]|nr:hypothetical protein [Candidatus Colimorpha onthohippi]